MKKNTSKHPLWIPVFITVISTLVLFVFAEYVFHIPSRFFATIDTQVSDDNSWTPRQKIVIPIPVPVESGTIENGGIACTMEYAPVCGADNHDYSNSCIARAGGTTVAYSGNCVKEKSGATSSGSLVQITPTVSGERDLSLFESGAYHIYENKTFGYKLALPKYAYYQGFGKSDPSNTYGADHILAVSLSSTGAESLATTEVQVILLKNNPSLVIAGRAVDLSNGSRIYVVAPDISNPKVAKIVETIMSSVQ